MNSWLYSSWDTVDEFFAIQLAYNFGFEGQFGLLKYMKHFTISCFAVKVLTEGKESQVDRAGLQFQPRLIHNVNILHG